MGFCGCSMPSSGCRWVEREQLAAEPGRWEVCGDGSAERDRPVEARSQPRTGQAELDTVAQRFAIAFPKTDKELGFHFEEAGALLPTQRAVFAAFLDGTDGGCFAGAVHCRLECREPAVVASGGKAPGDGGADCAGCDAVPTDTADAAGEYVAVVGWRSVWCGALRRAGCAVLRCFICRLTVPVDLV